MTEQAETILGSPEGKIRKRDREKFLKQKGVVIWFTGPPGSGKSKLAHTVEKTLFEYGHLSVVLDEENIRKNGLRFWITIDHHFFVWSEHKGP